ncbi:hypothetical protein HMPREF1503_1647 [Olsenella uli MSTE5]|nr:hypothetical protein HMPREF1503_1647 [Olsenella uli MSTE5]
MYVPQALTCQVILWVDYAKTDWHSEHNDTAQMAERRSTAFDGHDGCDVACVTAGILAPLATGSAVRWLTPPAHMPPVHTF